MSEQTFEQLLEASMKEIAVGDKIVGKVISVREDQIALNIGYKADGILKREDYTRDNTLDMRTVAKVGDEIEVKVKKLNDGEGQVVLSCRELVQSRLNEKIKALYESNQIQHGTVVEVNAGGMMVKVDNEVSIFIPKSLATLKRNDDMKELMGKEVDFIISEYNPKKNRVIGDRRSLLLEAENKKKEEALSKLHEGDIVEGTVVNVAAYGAFVDIGGVDGLLHSTEMGWGKRQNPAKVFKVGDKVKVMISEMKDGRISLTARFPEENPWTLARTNYAIGKVVKGTVARITPYGAFVSLDPYIDALLHISELRYEKVPKVEDVVKVGDVIEAKVIDFNEKEGKIALSIKALLPVPEKVKEEEADVADVDIESYAKKMQEENDESKES